MRRFLVTMGVLALAAMTPTVSRGDDQKIAETIISRLQVERDGGQLNGFNVKLEVKDGTVWIKGHVSEQRQQDLVLDIARRVPGVKQVVNDLDVARKELELPSPAKLPTPPRLSNSSPTPAPAPSRGLLSKLGSRDPQPIGSGVAEESSAIPAIEPVVTKAASGPIPVAEPKTGIRRTQGTTSASADQVIGQTLVSKLAAMDREGVLAGCMFDLHVENQAVYLEGTAASEQQRTAVLEVARRIRGVSKVVNGIKVQPTIRRTAAMTPGQPMQYSGMPVPMGQRPVAQVSANAQMGGYGAAPVPMHDASMGNAGGMVYDHPQLPPYAWPATAASPNYAAVQYPRQYSPSAWPYIGPFYPYPQVPLGWRSVCLEWDDGWWFLDFKSKKANLEAAGRL